MSKERKQNPSLTRNLQSHLSKEEALKELFKEENNTITKRKEIVKGEGIEPIAEPVGLALSGGGIRSATFCTGVLQVMEKLRFMRHVDYLSTVSGGGFAGSAYTAWKLRKTLRKKNVTADIVNTNPPDQFEGLLSHLRKFSKYLSPRLGFASEEFWRIIGTYFRNIILHWTVLLTAVISMFFAVLLCLELLKSESNAPVFVSGVFLALGLTLIVIGLKKEKEAKEYLDPKNGKSTQSGVPDFIKNLLQGTHLITFSGLSLWGIGSSFLFVWSTGFHQEFSVWLRAIPDVGFNPPGSVPGLIDWLRGNPDATFSVLDFGKYSVWLFKFRLLWPIIILGVSAILIVIIGWFSQWRWRARTGRALLPSPPGIFFVITLPFGLWFFLDYINHSSSISVLDPIWRTVWQPALSLMMMAMMVSIVIATYSKKMDREEREWTTRVVSTILSTAVVWFVISGLVFLGLWGARNISGGPGGLSLGAGAGFWAVISSILVYLGKNETFKNLVKTNLKSIVLFIGPAIFLIGLIFFTNMITAKVLISVFNDNKIENWGLLITLAGATGVVFFIAGYTLDANEFSLHGFYRDRLVRCYLGASNADSPAPDSVWNIKTDDLLISSLEQTVKDDGTPFHIINTAVNLFGSKSLRVQQRGCDSFFITPSYCGSRATKVAFTPKSLRIGTAVAVSGAAFSSNMGLATRGAAVAAVMTFFNLRLGYWFPNPRFLKEGKEKKRPFFSPFYLVCEALSLTNEDRHFVNLSDGGHFDNLGLYELIRRRCKFIVVVDAESDENYTFSSLGEVIRQVWIDFGVEIKLNFHEIAPPESNCCVQGAVSDEPPKRRYAKRHFTLGEILYPSGQEEGDWLKREMPHSGAHKGVILYIKNSLVDPSEKASLPSDVLEYAGNHPKFPHEPTSDQFFNEAQFESYRKLGEFIAQKCFDSLGYQGEEKIENWFQKLAAGNQ